MNINHFVTNIDHYIRILPDDNLSIFVSKNDREIYSQHKSSFYSLYVHRLVLQMSCYYNLDHKQLFDMITACYIFCIKLCLDVELYRPYTFLWNTFYSYVLYKDLYDKNDKEDKYKKYLAKMQYYETLILSRIDFSFLTTNKK